MRTEALGIVLLTIGVLLAGFMVMDSEEEQKHSDLYLFKYGNESIYFHPNYVNVTNSAGDYTEMRAGNHTITSYNSTYDVEMYWWCDNSNWTLVTE